MANLDAIAYELQQRATQVEAAGAQLSRAVAEALWTSVAADAFKARLSKRESQIHDAAGLLRAAARQVNAFATDVIEEKARLRRLEHAMIGVAAAGIGEVGHTVERVVGAVRW